MDDARNVEVPIERVMEMTAARNGQMLGQLQQQLGVADAIAETLRGKLDEAMALIDQQAAEIARLQTENIELAAKLEDAQQPILRTDSASPKLEKDAVKS